MDITGPPSSPVDTDSPSFATSITFMLFWLSRNITPVVTAINNNKHILSDSLCEPQARTNTRQCKHRAQIQSQVNHLPFSHYQPSSCNSVSSSDMALFLSTAFPPSL